jgi:hypothetical protein
MYFGDDQDMTKLTVYRDKCRHFNGIGFGVDGREKICGAGVNYRTLVGGDNYGWARRIPCLDVGDSLAGVVPCPQRRWLTQEEHAAHEAEVRAAIDKAFADIAAGKCHVCGADAEPSKRIGRCIYNACGHRRGQAADADEALE